MKDGTYKLFRSNRIKTGGFVPADHTSGYWVAQFHGTDVLVNGNMTGHFVRKTVLAMLDPSTYVGVWTDKDGNKHLDYAVHCTDLPTAVAQATMRGQIAIWDIVGKQEVLL
tara:strand:+ start:1279 stop:1611 length:333 start_codon:yes stop_codon:yes gene_type:complete